MPGSHLIYANYTRRFERNPNFFTDNDMRVPRIDASVKATKFTYGKDKDRDAYLLIDESLWQPVTMKAGDLLLIHGDVAHRSFENTSDKSRFAYAFYVVEGAMEWPRENWL